MGREVNGFIAGYRSYVLLPARRRALACMRGRAHMSWMASGGKEVPGPGYMWPDGMAGEVVYAFT